jgi:hypothetical protein
MADTKKFTEAFEALAAKFPKRYRVRTTVHLQGLLKALAEGDSYIATEVESVRDNLLVVTASGKNLDRLATNYGVERGRATGVQDDDFRKLIPLLGLTQKQILNTLQKIVDVIYGPYASHANTTCSVPSPYKITNSPALIVRVDGVDIKIDFRSADAVDPTKATAQELATVISNRSQGSIIGSVVTNVRTGEEYLNIRTNTIGPQGFIQVIGGDAQAVLRFPEVRSTRQDIGTWDITRYLGTDELVFTCSSGISPAMRTGEVKRGDYVAIRQDSGFAEENVGAFEVTFVDENSFRVRNGSGIPESSITQAHPDDFVFYKPTLANILLSNRPATVISTGANELTVILPVTSPIVKRTLAGGHHFHGGLSVANEVTSNTITVGSTNGFPASGSVHLVTSRRMNEGTVSSVTSNNVELISSEGWATSGAFYVPTQQKFYYYQGLSNNTLHNVTPTPTSELAGVPVKYSERFKYDSITDSTLNGVFPNPSSIKGYEITSNLFLEGEFVGSFLYDESAPFTAAANSTQVTEAIPQSSSKTVIQVGDVSSWPDQGSFVLQFASKEQEGPIRYYKKVGDKALIIDPGHVFERDHLTGTTIRLIRQIGSRSPSKGGEDFAVYLTGTSGARTLLSQYIASVIAAGITVKFKILVPDYKWPVLPLLQAENPVDTALAQI